MPAMASRPLEVVDLGRMSYADALARQERCVAERRRERAPDTLFLVEHDPVFTLGRNADPSHILASRDALAARGVAVSETGRGGDVTYHGPGQLVGYPILSLRERDRGVLWYVEGLEEILIRTLADFGIEAGRNPANRGAWVGNDKLAAIGVRITHHITMHGFALNVRTDLAYYKMIVPCGLSDKGVLSMHLLNGSVRMDDVKARVLQHFRDVFDYD